MEKRKKLEHYQKKLIKLTNYQLVGIYLDSYLSSLNLEFTSGNPSQDIMLRFTRIADFAISKDRDDDEGCFIVCETSIDMVSQENTNILILQNRKIEFPDIDLFHFQIDGCARVEVIFGHLDIFESQNQEDSSNRTSS